MNKNNWWAKTASIIFHPLILPTVAIAILFAIPSYLSFSIPPQARRLIIGLVFVNTFAAPLIIIILMRKTGLIKDISLYDRTERLYPNIVSVFFYVFTYYLFRQANLPSPLMYFIIAASILTLTGMIITFFWKISYHLMSMGGFTGFLIAISMFLKYEMPLLIVLSVLISGVLASARIKLNAHTPSQVYAGFCTGITIMLIVFFWLMR